MQFNNNLTQRRLLKRIEDANESECCYQNVTEYLITIRLSVQIFTDDILKFEHYTDLTVSNIVPIILFRLVLMDDIENVNNYSVEVDQVTASEYIVEHHIHFFNSFSQCALILQQYYMDISTDSHSHMIQFQTYAANELYPDYIEEYRIISMRAAMLESSIDFEVSTRKRLVFVDERATNRENKTDGGTEQDVGTNDDINYAILNEWYFVLVLLVCIIGMVIFSALMIKHYSESCGYDAVMEIGGNGKIEMPFIEHNIHLGTMSIASQSDDSRRSYALDEAERMTPVNAVESQSDQDSLLNSNNGDEHSDDAFLTYNNTKYDLI